MHTISVLSSSGFGINDAKSPFEFAMVLTIALNIEKLSAAVSESEYINRFRSVQGLSHDEMKAESSPFAQA